MNPYSASPRSRTADDAPGFGCTGAVHKARHWSWVTFLLTFINLFGVPVVLFVGICLGGNGHGGVTWVVWNLGLLYWLVAFAIMLASAALGIYSGARQKRLPWWVFAELLLVFLPSAYLMYEMRY